MSPEELLKLTYGRGFEMVQCVCGDVFHAEGFPDEITAARNTWQKDHEHCVDTPRQGMKTFWLSFCDNDRPKGQQFLGACVIDVTGEEADAAKIAVMMQFPFVQPDAEWIAAAISKAHRVQCNPGGEVATMEVPSGHVMLRFYQRNVLMHRATIERIDREIATASA